MATSTTTPRKPAARSTTARKSTPAAAKPAPTKTAPVKAAPAKATARATKAAAPAKEVSTIVAKNLKPVLAKKAKTAPVAKAVVTPKAVTKAAAQVKAATKVASKAAAPKVKKIKLVRDNFSIPADEHAVLKDLKKRAKALGKDVKKSEFLRAAIAHLGELADSLLLEVLSKVSRIKTGRPAKDKKSK